MDLGLSYHPRSRGPEVAVTLRPVALANPQSRFRTKALLGVLLPEMRYRPGAPGLDLAFTPIPIDFKILETFQMALRASALLEEAGTKNRWRPALALEFAYAL